MFLSFLFYLLYEISLLFQNGNVSNNNLYLISAIKIFKIYSLRGKIQIGEKKGCNILARIQSVIHGDILSGNVH